MQRRDVLKLLASAAAWTALPAEMLWSLREARAAEAGASFGLRTLDPHQNATVTTISELIIPETETPGAKGAKVNEFIDLLLTDWFDQSEKEQFLEGLAQIDSDSRKRFQADFVTCNAAQQKQLMQQFDDEAMQTAHAEKAAAKSDTNPKPAPNFFYTFKRLTLVGYYTSEIGFKQELGKTIIPPGHAGCAPMKEVRP